MKLIFGFVVTLFVASVIFGCDNAKDAPVKDSYLKQFKIGISYHEHKVEGEEKGRLYSLWIPKSYSRESATPLIVALHFGGRVSPYYGRLVIDSLVKPGLEGVDGIIVAPDSISGPWTNDENEQWVLELVEKIKTDFNIDDKRVAVTGFSMGGHGTWYIGGRNQDVFSAALPVAGSPKGDADWKIPLYVIHSEADSVVPIGPTDEMVKEMLANGKDVTFDRLLELDHRRTQLYAEPFKKAVPWLREKWGMEPKGENTQRP